MKHLYKYSIHVQLKEYTQVAQFYWTDFDPNVP